MFERMTERSRKSIVLAQEQARELKHNYIGTEHLLLGLLAEKDGLAAKALESLDITVERVRAQVVRIVGSGEEVTSGQIPFTPRAKKVLELALREALSLGHNYIGTEHILLGLVRENEGVAARILLDFDADSEKIRNEVIRSLTGPRKRQDVNEQEHYRVRSVREAKEIAINAGEFTRAAHLRDEERKVIRETGMDEKPDMLAPYLAAIALVDKNVRVNLKNGMSYEGYLTSLTPRIVKLQNAGVSHEIHTELIRSLSRA